MFCQNCGNKCSNRARFCSECGMPLPDMPRETKGRHWVPILIMVLIFSFGTALFFLLPGTPAPTAGSPAPMPWFHVEAGVLTFDDRVYDGGSELVIPEEIDGMPVTALAEGCFKNCDELISVTLPETLHAIGEDAFRDCGSLRAIEIPESVVLIGENAFADCASLEAVCVYDSLRSVGAGAFSGCSKLFYIYYSGNFQDWDELYSEFINPYTTVFSNDGTFYQGQRP